MVYLPALAVHQSTTSLSLERQTHFLFWIEPEWLKLGLRCLTCTSPTEQFSNVGEPAGGLGLPQGLLLLSFAGTTWPNPFAQRFLLGTGGRYSCRKLCGPGASCCAAAQRFPWAEPSCWWVSCPARLRVVERGGEVGDKGYFSLSVV